MGGYVQNCSVGGYVHWSGSPFTSVRILAVARSISKKCVRRTQGIRPSGTYLKSLWGGPSFPVYIGRLGPPLKAKFGGVVLDFLIYRVIRLMNLFQHNIRYKVDGEDFKTPELVPKIPELKPKIHDASRGQGAPKISRRRS